MTAPPMPIGADIKPEIKPNIILGNKLNFLLLTVCSFEFISKYVAKKKTTMVKKITNDLDFIKAAKVVPSKTPKITNNP